MFENQEQYFKAATSGDYKKPVVHYSPTIIPIVVGQSAAVVVKDHPAGYLNHAAWVDTSTVIAYDEVSGEFETRNTLYVPVK